MKIYQVLIDRSDEKSSSTIDTIIIDKGFSRLVITHEGDSKEYFGIYLDMMETQESVDTIFNNIKKDSWYKDQMVLKEV